MMNQIVRNMALAAVVLLFATDAFAADVLDCDKVRDDERACLACNIYHEARNQEEQGQLAVALVTVNRVLNPRWSDSVCGVVWQEWQFSWTNDGKSDKVRNFEKWEEAYTIANRVLDAVTDGAKMVDITGNAYYYHANYVKPKWAPLKQFTVAIQDHLFYTDPPQVARSGK